MAKKKSVLYILNFLFLCTIVIKADAASSNLVKLKCQELCGKVHIPFPFGIGSGCFLDDWYEILCRQNNTVPFLKKNDLQVLHISLPTNHSRGASTNGMIRVNHPLAYNCTGKVPHTKLSLEGTPFIFSQTRNVLTLVGCNVHVMMNTSEDAFVGCKVKCKEGNFSRYRTCSGSDNCCQDSIPFGLQAFSVEFMRIQPEIGTDDQQCNYAFLADQTWFRASTMDLDALKIKGFVPVVLEWGISKATVLGRVLHKHNFSRFEGPNYVCQMESITSNDVKMPFVQCYCDDGYRGNPYLILIGDDYRNSTSINDGCEDVDECEDPRSNSCPEMCVNKPGSYKCEDGRRKLKFVMIGIGSGIGALFLLLGISWLYKIIKERKEKKLKEKYFKRNGGHLLQQQLSSPEGSVEKSKLFNQKELEKATDNFNESRVVGKGGQGTVYKGMLADGRIVAIKKAIVIDVGKVEQFVNEVIILSQINHRNIVKLLGCCLETEIPLLVYEFIPNGTLYDYIHDSNKEIQVLWEMRLQLAIEIAGALCYLHSAASIPIYHRDIKSTNILLDEKYRAKVADFGTSKSVSLDQTHATTLIKGTFGYLDPEYFQSSQITDKSDVYSFGVVLVELLTGQKPISSLRAKEGRNLATYFILSIEEGHLFDILDPKVTQQGMEEEIVKVAKLAERCLHLNGRNRPTMKEVAMELEGIKRVRNLSHIQQNLEEGEAIKNLNDASTSGIQKQEADELSLSNVEMFFSSTGTE